MNDHRCYHCGRSINDFELDESTDVALDHPHCYDCIDDAVCGYPCPVCNRPITGKNRCEDR